MKKSTYHIFFTILSNSLRIEIVGCLKFKGKSVNEISKELNVEQSKVSHALASLKSCRIVHVRKKGKQRIYTLNKTILPILKLIDEHSKSFCGTKCEECEEICRE
jgi:DNA-binding transcriptional ArsR family regulator